MERLPVGCIIRLLQTAAAQTSSHAEFGDVSDIACINFLVDQAPVHKQVFDKPTVEMLMASRYTQYNAHKFQCWLVEGCLGAAFI
jgi:hypothetical protein